MGSPFRGLKHLLGAVLLIAALLALAEVGLRVQRWSTGNDSLDVESTATADALIGPSVETFQALRPLAAVVLRDPDDNREVLVRTNSLGLRGPEVVLPKPAGVFRVICLGDETTLALDRPEPETYCARLQERLQQQTRLEVEVINAGLPGGCPLSALLLLRHRLLGLQPDLVLLHLDPSDLADDRTLRPFLHFDASDVPVAAVHPLCDGRAASSVTRLAEEFALVDLVCRHLGGLWEQSSGRPEDLNLDHRDREAAVTESGLSDRLARQALEPITEIRRLLAGVYCELVVTTLDDRFAAALEGTDRATAAHARDNTTVAGPGSTHALLFCDASAVMHSGGTRPSDQARLSAADLDRYAAAQAAFVVQHVPGVWTGGATPGVLQPLPGVARSPRGATE